MGPNSIKVNGVWYHVGGTEESGDWGSTANPSAQYGSRAHKSYAAVVDLLCHGEIEGLVGGANGVYMNGTPLASSASAEKTKPIYLRAYNSGGNHAGSIDSKDAKLTFRDDSGTLNPLRYYGRHVIVRKGLGKHTTSAVMSVGDTFLPTTALDGTGTNSGQARRNHLKQALQADVPLRVQILHSTGDLFFYIKGIPEKSNNTPGGLELMIPPNGIDKEIPSGSEFYIDWGGKAYEISTDGKDIYLMPLGSEDLPPTNSDNGSSLWPSDGTLAELRFSPVQTGATFSQSYSNFPDTFVHFKRGTRYQQGPTGDKLAPVASFTKSSGSGMGVNMHMYTGIPGHDGTIPVGTTRSQGKTLTQGGAVVLNASEFSFGQSSASEIDSFDVDIEFPGGLFAVSENGNHYSIWAEHQIIFRYKNVSSGGEYIDHLLVGINHGTASGSTSFDSKFVHNLSYPSGPNRFRSDLEPRYKFDQNSVQWKRRQGAGTTIGRAQVTPFINTYHIDVSRYQPFTDWQIVVRRLNPSNPKEIWSTMENSSASAHSQVKSVTANIHEKLSYPLTAYSIIGYSASDFPSPPSRSYKVKGRLIQVPTNYLTRDEIANSEGDPEVSYNRHVTNGTKESTYQTWDGKFRGDPTDTSVTILNPNYWPVYCNNPAWVFYDLLINKDYGLGEFVNPDDIDKYALYQIARYCDELVPDGHGGKEPRFTCNVVFKKQTEAYKVLKDLASTFRAMMYWIDGQITAIQDRPKEPVYTFTTGNVKDGTFEYSYTGERARTNQVRASWNDPNQLYKQAFVTAEDLPNIASQGKIITKDVVAFGCTSEGQAKRVAQWHLETEIRETEIVTFSTGLNGAYLRPGDIINVQDKRLASIEASGRVQAESTSTSIKLDRTVTFPGGSIGSSCNLYLIYPDPGIYLQQETATINSVVYNRGELLQTDSSGATLLTGATQEKAANLKDDSGNPITVSFSPGGRVEVEAITNTTTSTNTVTTSGAFAGGAPAADTIWAISREDTVTTDDIKQYRIAGISETEVNEYSITATQYTVEKFDEIDSEAPPFTGSYVDSSSREGEVPSPNSVAVTMELNPNGREFDAIITWETPTDTYTDSNGDSFVSQYKYLRGYKVRHSFDDDFSSSDPLSGSGAFVMAGTNSFRVKNVDPLGSYRVSVTTLNDVGNVSLATSRSVSFAPKTINIRNRSIDIATAIGLDGQLLDSAGTITVTSPATVHTASGSFVTTNSSGFDFTSMVDGNTAFLYLDVSESAANRLKKVVIHEDTTSAQGYSYLKELGASNNGLAAAAGTLASISNGTKILGTSTTFTTDFAVGDLIKFSTQSGAGTEHADSEYRVVTSIDSDLSLTVDSPISRRGTSGGFFAASGTKYIFKQSLKPDFEADAYVTTISRSGSTYTMATPPFVPVTANATRNESKGAWASGTDYKIGDIVTFSGSSYTATSDHTSSSTNEPTDSGAPWNLLSAKGDTGITGASINFAFVRVPYGTTASAVVANASGTSTTPATFTVSSVTYTWSDTIPSGTGTLYTVEGSKTPPATGFVWGTPRQLEGDSHAELVIYSDVVASGGSAPSDPTACTYNFTTGVLSIAGDNASSWNKAPPSLESAADGSKVFAITAVVSGAPGDTAAAIAASDWTAAFVHSRHEKGDTGATGEGTEVIYYVSKSAPSTPTASAANDLDTGWSTNVPTATENVWVSLGSRATGATDYTWGAPSLLQEVTSNLLLNQKMLPWEVGTGNATVPGGTWPDNGPTAENTRSLLTDPFGGKSVIWRAINSGTDNNADGGFHSPQVEIDPAKEYRFSLFINQKNSTNGTTYFGLHGYNASGTNTALEYNNGGGTTTTNPYFWHSDLPTLDKWYLLIGYLVPHNDTDETIHPDSGIWDPATGKKVTISDDYYDFKFQSTHTKARMRAYQYYNTSSANDEVHFFAPRIDIADERMPSVQDLLRTAAVPSNTATVYAYKKANSLPGNKPDETRTYTFDTGAFNDSDLGNSWSSTLAGAGTDDNMYICQAQVSSEEATVSVTASDWSSAFLLTEKGEKGLKGDEGAGTEYIFARTANESTSPPARDNSWGFDNPGLSSSGSPRITSQGWYDAAPTLTRQLPVLWRAERDIEGTPDTGDAVSANWSNASIVGRFAAPERPAASYFITYDNLETATPDAPGEWAFKNSSNAFSDSFSELRSAPKIYAYKSDSSSPATDHSSYFNQLEVGDIFTLSFKDSPPVWASFKVTAKSLSNSVYEFTVTNLDYNDAGLDNNSLSVSDNTPVSFRFSRAAEGVGATTTATVYLYKNSTPNAIGSTTMPTGTFEYTFSTNSIVTTGGAGSSLNGWETVPAALTAGQTTYYIYAVASAPATGTTPATTADLAASDFSTTPLAGSHAGSDAYSVSLTANKYAVSYAGTTATGDALVFTAAPQGVTGTAKYKFEVDSGSGFVKKSPTSGDTQTSATYTMLEADEPAAGAAKVVKVTLYDGTDEVATDSVSIYGVRDGTDAVTVVLTNEAHVFPTSPDGTVDYSGGGTGIRVYKGSTALTPGTGNNQFQVTSVSGTNIDPSSSSSTSGTTVTYSAPDNMSASTASITYTITINNYSGFSDLEITKVQTFSKTVGIKTVNLYKLNDDDLDNNSFGTFADPDSGAETGWTEDIPALEDNNDKVYVISRTFTSDGNPPQDTAWTDPVVYSQRTDGASAKGLSLILGATTIAFDNSTGTPALSPSGTTQDIEVSTNLQNISGTPTLSILTSTGSAQSDLVFTGGDTNGVISAASGTIDASSWGTVTLGESVQVKASLTSDGVEYTDTQSVHAVFSGETGDEGGSVNIVFIRSVSKPTTPSNDPAPVPSGWSDSPPSGTDLLWASRGLKAAGQTDYVWQSAFQIEGAAHAEVYIYRKNSNAGNSGGSYNFTNNTLTVPSNWAKDPQALTADGDKVYVSVGLATGASTATTAGITWGTPAVYAQRTDGAAGIPAASTLIDYDDLEPNNGITGNGQWFFLSNIQDAVSSSPPFGNEFDELQNATQIGISNSDKDGTNHSEFYAQAEAGDVLTARINDTAWVSYRITETAAETGYRTFNVTPFATNNAGVTSNDLSYSDGNVVQMRFSRAPKGDAGLGGIATLKLYRGSNTELDDDDRPSNVGVTFNSDGSIASWSSNVNDGTDSWKSNLPSMLSTEGKLDVYEIETSVNREDSISNIAQSKWSTPTLIRYRETWSITKIYPRPIHIYSGSGMGGWTGEANNAVQTTAVVTASSSHNSTHTVNVRSKINTSSAGNWTSLSTSDWEISEQSETPTNATNFSVSVQPMSTSGTEKSKDVLVTHTSPSGDVEVEFKCRALNQ